MILLSSILSSGVAVLLSGSLIDLDGTAVLHLAIFFAAFFVLRATVFRPMIKLFDAREAATEGARREAKELQASASSSAETFDAKMREVRLKAGEERDRLRADAAKREQEILADVTKELKGQAEAARKKLATDASRLRSDIDREVPVLAKQIASKLLDREVV